MKLRETVGLTYDDCLLEPGYTDFLDRSEVDLSTYLTSLDPIKIPLISSPMDTVTESKLAIALAKMGGIGIIHRYLSIEDQVKEIEKVKKQGLKVGAAVPASAYYERVEKIVEAGADVIVVDNAHGHSRKVMEATKSIRKHHPIINLISGSVATSDGAKALLDCGADGLRVGMGPGAICTTRIVSGMGVPQLRAIEEARKVVDDFRFQTPIIADGGINYSGDVTKALAAGASSVMIGRLFAPAVESPGKIVTLKSHQVPSRFHDILKPDVEEYQFKEYRGMGSEGAIRDGIESQSEEEFHGQSFKGALVAEGVEGLVPVQGTLKEIVEQILGGVRAGFYYVGAKNIAELWEKAVFSPITQASLSESHPHNILITNPGKSYY